MYKRFGKAFQDLPIHKRGPGSHLMEDFQRIKHNFDRNDHIEDLRIYLKMKLDPGELDSSMYDFEDEEIILSR